MKNHANSHDACTHHCTCFRGPSHGYKENKSWLVLKDFLISDQSFVCKQQGGDFWEERYGSGGCWTGGQWVRRSLVYECQRNICGAVYVLVPVATGQAGGECDVIEKAQTSITKAKLLCIEKKT